MNKVLYEKKGDLSFVTLNRPEALNAENEELLQDFVTALEKARWDDTKVTILRGNGRAFCAGADIKEGQKPRTVEHEYYLCERVMEISRLTFNLNKPIIAGVQGYAMGGGAEFAMNADIRICADNCVWGFPETTVGATVTNLGNQTLSRLIGIGRAKELILTGRRIDAKTALEWGLCNKVVPLADLEKECLEMAKLITSKDQIGIRLARMMLDTGMDVDAESMLRIEILAAATSFATLARIGDMKKQLEKIHQK